MTGWSSHSEAMLQAALDDVDWDMFRANSSDVSEFTDVALSFVNTLNEQATETVTIRTFSNQKPWVDRTIFDAVNHRTAAYNAGLLSVNMSEYKALCYALRHAVRAAKLRYRERNESHFQLNDSRRMWQGLKTIRSSGNKSSAEVRADPLLAEELNTLYGCFECNGGRATLPISASGSSRQSSDDHVERVSNFKYLGLNISEDLTWTAHIQTQFKKARKRLNHLRQLRKFRVSPAILKTFYSRAIESVLTQCISVWYGNSSAKLCRELCA